MLFTAPLIPFSENPNLKRIFGSELGIVLVITMKRDTESNEISKDSDPEVGTVKEAVKNGLADV